MIPPDRTTFADLVKLYKDKYKSFQNTLCPYLNKEIKFTMSGFKHLLWKREFGKRSRKTILERLTALEVVTEIISKSGPFKNTKI